MFPFIAVFEAWAVAKLVRSPAFNRAIQTVHKKINRIEDMEPKNGLGRTGPSAFDHFRDEVKGQFKELTWQKKNPRQ